MIIGIDARELSGQATGAGRYLRSLLRVWSRSPTDRLVAYVDGRPPAAPQADGIVWRSLGTGHTRGVVWQERLLPRAARADGVEVFFSPAYHCPLLLARPRVTAVHDLSYFSHSQDFSFLDGLRRRLLVAASVRASRAVLACSRFTLREIARRFPDAAERVHHVPLGADDSLPPGPPRADARRHLGLAGPFVLWVGSILNRRCLSELLAAAALIRGRWPELTIEIIGDNRTHPRLDAAGLIRRAGLTSHVRLSGFVSEGALALRYAAADVLVQLSEYEGFGLPALEAMARGVPVVASARPALDEIVGDAGLLVDPRDPRAIAEALARVIGDASYASGLIAHGKSHAARFSWTTTAERTLSVLRQAARP